MFTNVTLKFQNIEDNLPPRADDEFYGHRYSVPVLIANSVTGQIFDRIVRFDYRGHGWVFDGLPDGPDPENYEVIHVTHWASFPTSFSFDGHQEVKHG